MNVLCHRALHCYRIPCAVSTDEGSMPFDCTITEMLADSLYLAGKRCRWKVIALANCIASPCCGFDMDLEHKKTVSIDIVWAVLTLPGQY